MANDDCHIHCLEKRDQQYLGNHFNKFRQIVIIFGMVHPYTPTDKLQNIPTLLA